MSQTQETPRMTTDMISAFIRRFFMEEVLGFGIATPTKMDAPPRVSTVYLTAPLVGDLKDFGGLNPCLSAWLPATHFVDAIFYNTLRGCCRQFTPLPMSDIVGRGFEQDTHVLMGHPRFQKELDGPHKAFFTSLMGEEPNWNPKFHTTMKADLLGAKKPCVLTPEFTGDDVIWEVRPAAGSPLQSYLHVRDVMIHTDAKVLSATVDVAFVVPEATRVTILQVQEP